MSKIAEREVSKMEVVTIEKPGKNALVEDRVKWGLEASESILHQTQALLWIRIDEFYDSDIGDIDIKLGRIEKGVESLRRLLDEAKRKRITDEVVTNDRLGFYHGEICVGYISDGYDENGDPRPSGYLTREKK